MGDTLGHVVTFYSYKGGVGRTFALADVAVALARWGFRVLCMDWDLEAPGLDVYFEAHRKTPASGGLLDWIEAFARGEPQDWRRGVEPLFFSFESRLDFFSAGAQGERYSSRVQEVSWPTLYANGFGRYLEDARGQWTRAYDFVLVDSRTGFSDIGGVCTIQLPDTLVALFTPNRQSMEGGLRVARSAVAAQRAQPIDRATMRVIPVVTRVELNEYEHYRTWFARIAEASAPFFEAWRDEESPQLDAAALVARLAVPYVPFWSYGEQLATLRDETYDSKSVRYAHDALAALLAREFELPEELVANRDEYVRIAEGRKAERNNVSVVVGNQQLYDALCSAFPTRVALEQMVSFGLGENLNTITGTDSLHEIVFGLIEWASSRGRTAALIAAAHASNSSNPQLAALAGRFWNPMAFPMGTSLARGASRYAIVFTALASEFRAVLEQLDDIHEITHPTAGAVYEVGQLTGSDWKVVLVEVGAGNVPAPLEAGRAIELFQPQAVLIVGVAGGVKNVKLGDVVVATKVYAYEFVKGASDGFNPRHEYQLAGYALLQRAKAEARRSDWMTRVRMTPLPDGVDVVAGPIVIGDGTRSNTDSKVLRFLRAHYPDALAVEMEGDGVVLATHQHKIDALVVRGISGLMGDRSKNDVWPTRAAHHAAAFAMHVLSKL